MRLEGREAIREYSRRVMASPLQLEDFEGVELYQTQDPEVVIVELRTKGTLTTTGRSVTALLATLQELEHLGVGFVSLTEALDLTTPVG